MKVTILTASTGNGHLSAASALEAVFKERGATVSNWDSLQFAPYAFRQWYGGGYELIVRTRPQLYGNLYKVSDKPTMSFKVQSISDFVFQRRLRKLLEDERPDWVVCTHSLPQPRLAQLREELGFFRIAVVLTDLYPHLMWLRGNPDHFFVPTDYSKELLIQRRRQYMDRISVTGIPVHPVFGKTYDPQAINELLGRDPKLPMITMTSGGIGGGPFAAAVMSVIELGRPMHLEVICGRNEHRRKQIERMVEETDTGPVVVKVRGQISQEEMAMRMQESEFMVSKPGGLTTSECLAMGCAMLVYEPFLIPGQEEGNSDFLESSGCGVKASTPTELGRKIRELLDFPEKTAEMRRIAKSFGKPNAAADIVDEILAMG